jgi:hypothetical protein
MRNKRNTATGWHRPLATPIKLRDGHVIETLAQAAGLMTQRLPKARQLKPVWQRTAALLMEAHASGKPDDLQHATGQLQRALDAEGWAA